MITRRIAGFGICQLRLLAPVTAAAGLRTCAESRQKSCPGPKKKVGQRPVCPGKSSGQSRKVCPGSGKGRSSSGGSGRASKGPTGALLVRAETPGKVCLGFLPEEWFRFLHPKTGVSGPYILMLGFINYVCSKEVYVMEHEYYSGLSIALILYLVTTNFGRQIGAALDVEVKAFEDDMQKDRDQEVANHNEVIKNGQISQAQAKAQELLMAVKKENITFQLEAAYRERLMMVYRTVRDRLQYHMKRSRTVGRIQQRWMVKWILENVNKSITPEFQKQALSSAIRDLAAAASQVKK